MRITLARSAGFCFGVRRAITIALDTAKARPKGKRIEMLGEIVHNTDVVREIRKAGIHQIKRLSKDGRGRILLLRAHGATRATVAAANAAGYTLVDATCPMVKEIHRIARAKAPGCDTVIVIGDRRHDEVLGIVGQVDAKTIVIDDISRVPSRKALTGIRSACVVLQSTQNAEKVRPILALLRARIKQVSFHDTICRPTRVKQEEMKRMPREHDVMIIIGSRHSANTRRLYEISRAQNPRSHWIDGPAKLKSAWFAGASSVGVTAGASTPEETITRVIARIKAITKKMPR